MKEKVNKHNAYTPNYHPKGEPTGRTFEFYQADKGYFGLLSEKIGRNEPCPCGSGKKAKKCCGTQTKYKNREIDKNTVEEKKLEDLKNNNL